jgi:hypothetical protein
MVPFGLRGGVTKSPARRPGGGPLLKKREKWRTRHPARSIDFGEVNL